MPKTTRPCFVVIREQIDEETAVEGIFLTRKDAHDAMNKLVAAQYASNAVDSCGPFWTTIKASLPED